ncbi:nuclear transport factor 2 family protein [Halomonas binhaiensis]|uniref:Nuclear transport factor 2 family protein n=1 Tax=Halomonas binhaiensis TaxID=2562282 RepID=A0A5C1NIG0_9GAMM|nr:nuclear transport factor 2 family protein [Halomonas binhaiensis]QEM82650.1 nuclear transport factor 2 family protein [Halomonas binhaiensis]
MKSPDPKLFLQVHDVLCRFFLAFDQRDWASMVECLAPQVSIDYASSGREPPSTMSAQDFVKRRQNAVDGLTKQHSFSNLLIRQKADEGVVSARCNYLILRFELSQAQSQAHTQNQAQTQNQSQAHTQSQVPAISEENFFHSCGNYEFLLRDIQGEWKISSIKQNALQSWGNAALHGGSSQGRK